MSLMTRLFRRREHGVDARVTEEEPPCPHVVLVPGWDRADDIGNEDKVTEYLCDSCKATFSPEDGRRMMAHEAERVPLEEPRS